MTGARVTWTGSNVRGGTITGLSIGEGGKGITHPVVQEAYDNVPNDKCSDPRMHGRCAEAEALSKGAEKANVTNMEELRKLAKNSVSTANRNWSGNRIFNISRNKVTSFIITSTLVDTPLQCCSSIRFNC